MVDVPSLADFGYQLNPTRPPFDNKALRQAVAYAIDNEAIVKGVWLGVGVPSNGPISPSSWAYDNTIPPIKRDLAKAKAKLAEGGKPDGFTFDFTIDNTPLSIQEAEVVKAQLAEAGITMNVKVVDGDAARRRQWQDVRVVSYAGAAGLIPTATRTSSSTPRRAPRSTGRASRTRRSTSCSTRPAISTRPSARSCTASSCRSCGTSAGGLRRPPDRAEGVQPEGPGLRADPGRDDALQGRLVEVAPGATMGTT